MVGADEQKPVVELARFNEDVVSKDEVAERGHQRLRRLFEHFDAPMMPSSAKNRLNQICLERTLAVLPHARPRRPRRAIAVLPRSTGASTHNTLAFLHHQLCDGMANWCDASGFHLCCCPNLIRRLPHRRGRSESLTFAKFRIVSSGFCEA